MESGGPFGFDEPPDDFGPGDPDDAPRGWVHPDDRLWRHPSELGRADPPLGGRPRSWRPATRLGTLVLGVAGAVVVTGVALAMTAGGSSGPDLTGPAVTGLDTSMVTEPVTPANTTAAPTAPVAPAVVQVVDSESASLVTLIPDGSGPAPLATGVVLPSRTFVVTAASAVEEGQVMTVLTADGQRLRGVVQGVDAHSGIAVVQVSGPLVPADFVDEAVSANELAVTACRCDKSTGTPGSPAEPDVALGMVHAVGTPATDDGGPTLVDAIEAEIPLGSAMGAVLIDDEGGVLGILDGERSAGGDTFGYFVPAPLALGVADELAQFHHVDRSWLGVVCQDAGGAGAAITTVIPDSPAAAAGLQPGDIVEAVDSHAVSSLADLQGRLYPVLPGTELELTILRDGTIDTTSVTLGALPS